MANDEETKERGKPGPKPKADAGEKKEKKTYPKGKPEVGEVAEFFGTLVQSAATTLMVFGYLPCVEGGEDKIRKLAQGQIAPAAQRLMNHMEMEPGPFTDGAIVLGSAAAIPIATFIVKDAEKNGRLGQREVDGKTHTFYQRPDGQIVDMTVNMETMQKKTGKGA